MSFRIEKDTTHYRRLDFKINIVSLKSEVTIRSKTPPDSVVKSPVSRIAPTGERSEKVHLINKTIQ